MTTRVRTPAPIKAKFSVDYANFMHEKTSARYKYALDCVYLLLGDKNVRKKTAELIGEDKLKEYEQKCDQANAVYALMGDWEHAIEKLAQRKDYETFEKMLNNALWRAQSQKEPIDKPVLILLALLMINTDIEDLKVQRTEVNLAKQRTIQYNPLQNRMQAMDYRDTSSVPVND